MTTNLLVSKDTDAFEIFYAYYFNLKEVKNSTTALGANKNEYDQFCFDVIAEAMLKIRARFKEIENN